MFSAKKIRFDTEIFSALKPLGVIGVPPMMILYFIVEVFEKHGF